MARLGGLRKRTPRTAHFYRHYRRQAFLGFWALSTLLSSARVEPWDANACTSRSSGSKTSRSMNCSSLLSASLATPEVP